MRSQIEVDARDPLYYSFVFVDDVNKGLDPASRFPPRSIRALLNKEKRKKRKPTALGARTGSFLIREIKKMLYACSM